LSRLTIERRTAFAVAQPQRASACGAKAEKAAEAAAFAQMKESLRSGGVKVVSAPQLFPTPAALARQVVDLADIQPGMTVLEPSAGTGALVRAIPAGVRVVAVELVANLARALEYMAAEVRCGDFLAMNGELGTFDRIVMNPPFANAADIRHIEHARGRLKPGGRLVAICAAGPRHRERFEETAAEWIDLPAGSFKEQGTNVNAAIVVIEV
jgi:cyclopropane fatty-acyl-phospholipid synthase-like methyltransferase